MKIFRLQLILGTFLFILSTSTKAQGHKYIPFPDSNYIWVVDYFDEFGNYDYGFQYVLNDTITINNVVYRTFDRTSDTNLTPGPYFYYGLRNDTLNRRVYIYDVQSGKEHLLYDFSLRVGDTVPKDYVGYAGSIITHIDSIVINGNVHHVFIVDNNVDRFPYIEGIGGMAGPLQKNYSFEGRYRLRCTMIQSTLSSYYSIPGVECKLYQFTGNEEFERKEDEVKIFPNPIDNNTVIQLLNKNEQIDGLEVYSLNGQEIISVQENVQKYQLSRDKFESSGLYFIKVTTSSGIVIFEKVLVN